YRISQSVPARSASTIHLRAEVRREIAGEIVGIRNCSVRTRIRDRKNGAKAFEREIEEGLVVPVIEMRNPHGSAECAAEIVLPAGGAGSRIRLVGVQGLISKTIEKTAVILVGAGLCGEVEDAALSLAELGRVVPGLQADFFQRFDRWLLVEEKRRSVQVSAV